LSRYVESSLANGEAVEYSATVSLWRYWLYFIVGGFIVLAAASSFVRTIASHSGSGGSSAGTFEGIFLLLGLATVASPFLARKATELVVTDKRVIAKFGIISTHSIEMRLEKVESVRVIQGVVGRIFNYGDIVVTGTGSTFDPIPNISNPLAFRSALNQAMELARPGPR
jgi:uncharacterized membrane protein YdbT with pleckstrin-like domain